MYIIYIYQYAHTVLVLRHHNFLNTSFVINIFFNRTTCIEVKKKKNLDFHTNISNLNYNFLMERRKFFVFTL